MRIAINATAAVAGGSITYLLNLLPALAKTDDRNEYIILLSRHQDKIHLDLPDNSKIEYVTFPRPFVIWRLFWEQTVLPLWLARIGADVLFASMDIAALLAPCPVVLAVHNPNPYYKLTISGNYRVKYKLQKWISSLSAHKACKVIFVSYQARDTIAPQLGIPYEKTEVAYHGLDHKMFDPNRDFDSVPPHFRKKIEGLQPFVLCVSTMNPHKDYDTLFRGWAKLRGGLRDKNRLVIAGRRSSPEYFNWLTTLVEKLDIGHNIVFLGEVPYRSMPYLYRRASALVLPSILETFGLPLVEAMAMKVPVVAASSTCIPEITDDSALLFEPQSPKDLSLMLERALTESDLCEALIEKGRCRAQHFFWQRTAQKTLDILEAVAEKA